MLSGLLRVLVVGLVLLVAAVFMLPRPGGPVPRPDVATVIEEPRPLPAFELTDTAGRPFTKARLEGGMHLLFFGFTNCPDVCPLTLQSLAQVRPELERRYGDAAPGVVFVSVDPKRDTPEQIASYLGSFDSGFTGATGTDAALAPLLETLGVAVRKQELEGESYNVTHSGHVFVIGPEGEWRAVFRPSTAPETIVADYARIHRAVTEGIAYAPLGP